jgi:glycosyltransferase involved in cell wall biosynthesis
MSVRLLMVVGRPAYPMLLGGAARFAHELLTGLAEEHDVMALCKLPPAAILKQLLKPSAFDTLSVLGVEYQTPMQTVVDCGYTLVCNADVHAALDELLVSFSPTVVWSQLDGAVDVLARARRADIPSVYFVHDVESPDEMKRGAEMAVNFVASSQFIARRVEDVTGCHCHIVRPPVRSFSAVADELDTGSRQQAIGMINMARVKGIETFVSIAGALPEQEFVLLESWPQTDEYGDELRGRLPQNVRMLRRQPDPASFYRSLKLLLVPSVWEEGFGMVCLEAQRFGVPVIASKRGGLPESVGKGGVLIDDYLNVDSWVQYIGSLLDDNARYRELQAEALSHANSRQFTPAFAVSAFRAIVEDTVGA